MSEIDKNSSEALQQMINVINNAEVNETSACVRDELARAYLKAEHALRELDAHIKRAEQNHDHRLLSEDDARLVNCYRTMLADQAVRMFDGYSTTEVNDICYHKTFGGWVNRRRVDR